MMLAFNLMGVVFKETVYGVDFAMKFSCWGRQTVLTNCGKFESDKCGTCLLVVPLRDLGFRFVAFLLCFLFNSPEALYSDLRQQCW